MRRSPGFSLIEMLTAVALMAVVLGGVFTALGAMQSGITDLSARQGLRLEAEHFLGLLREDLQYARWDTADAKLRHLTPSGDVSALELQRQDSGQWVRYVFDRNTDELRRELFSLGLAPSETRVLGLHLDAEVVKMPRDNNGIFDLNLKLKHTDNLGVVHDLERNLVVWVIQG